MELELDRILSKSLLRKRKLINYKDCFLFDKYEHIADYVENFEVRDDDVWVCTFPKSGTTWMQEMVWNIANDLDFKRSEIPIDVRFPYLEFPVLGLQEVEVELDEESTKVNSRNQDLQYMENLAKLPSPRFIKSHLPFHLLPRQLREGEKKCKIIYVSRNPKDTCISAYHFFNLFMYLACTFEDFCKLFLGDRVAYGPYWNHVNSYFDKKDKSNIMCIKFEEMKSDLRSVMKKVAMFLGKILSDEQLKRLEHHLSFANMKDNPAVNYDSYITKIHAENEKSKETVAVEGKFIRSGEAGQWKTVMSQELIKQFDDWIAKNSNNVCKL